MPSRTQATTPPAMNYIDRATDLTWSVTGLQSALDAKDLARVKLDQAAIYAQLAQAEALHRLAAALEQGQP